MTNDELEEKIYNIKKEGHVKVVTTMKIRSLLIKNNKEKYSKVVQDIHERTIKNIRHVARVNKIPFSEKNFAAFTGHGNKFLEYQKFFYGSEMSLYIPMLASLMYNVPLDMLLFHDMEIYNEENIKDHFPHTFRNYID